MENQAFYVGQNLFRVGIGLGGVFNIFCCATAALATSLPENLASAVVQRPVTELNLDLLGTEPLAQTPGPESPLMRAITFPQLDPPSSPLDLHPSANNAHKYDHLVAIQDGYHPQFSPQTVPQQVSQTVPQTVPQTAPQAAPQNVSDKRPHKPATRLTVQAEDRRVSLLNIVKLTPSLITLSALENPQAANRSSGEHSVDVSRAPSADLVIPNQLSIEVMNRDEATKSTPDERAELPPSQGDEAMVAVDFRPSALMSEEERPSRMGQAADIAVVPEVAPEGDLRTAQADRSENQEGQPDDELGILRLQQTRSRANEELGILRLLQTAQAPPPPPKPPITFLTGRLGFFDSDNAFRSNSRRDESIYQSGLAFYLVPKLSDNTSLYAIAETNLARYDGLKLANYNEVEVQFGVRQRLSPRTYAQVGWRNQRLYTPGYREKLFGVNYLDTLISHRSILNSRTWLDSFYQARLGFANQDNLSPSRFRQTFTLSLNHGVTRELRTSLLYQLDFDDYTQISRYDTYQQLLGIISYKVTPESRITLFGGTRFGRSSNPSVNLDDTFYGAGINVSVPLF